MADLSSLFGGNFNASEVERVETEFKPLPKGDYPVTITESEVGPSNNGNATILTLKIVVSDGKYTNRVLFDSLCVQHSTSPVAQQIAQTRLAQICDAVNVKQLKDTSQLHDKPLIASLKTEIDKYQTDKAREYDPSAEPVYRNSITKYGPAVVTQQPAQPAMAEMADDDIPF